MDRKWIELAHGLLWSALWISGAYFFGNVLSHLGFDVFLAVVVTVCLAGAIYPGFWVTYDAEW